MHNVPGLQSLQTWLLYTADHIERYLPLSRRPVQKALTIDARMDHDWRLDLR